MIKKLFSLIVLISLSSTIALAERASSTCYDSDGGVVPEVKGISVVEVYETTCIDTNKDKDRKTCLKSSYLEKDMCINVHTLVERKCNGGDIESVQVDCKKLGKICMQGFCQ